MNHRQDEQWAHNDCCDCKALLGDNPGWEVERMKMKREARDHNRAMKKLQNENEQMKKELDDLGVVREAEK